MSEFSIIDRRQEELGDRRHFNDRRQAPRLLAYYTERRSGQDRRKGTLYQ